MLLADLGAEVIRAENPETGRDGGFAGPTHQGYSIYYAVYNRGKKSIGLNLRRPEGRELFGKLVTKVDVIVENFRPSYLDRLGFPYSVLRSINPRLILVSISGYGKDGPYAERTAFCNVALAAAGYLDVSGDPFSPVHQTGVSIADRLAGVHAAVGAMAALVGRATTGEGAHVDVSLMDAALTMIEFPLATYMMTGRRPSGDPKDRRAGASPNQVFRAKDGLVIINAPNQDQWLRLLSLMERDDLASDPRFESPLKRQTSEARIAIEELIAAWIAPLVVEAACLALLEADVPAAPVRTIDQVADDPQLQHRRMLMDTRHPTTGIEMRLVGNPVKLAGVSDDIGFAAERGEHNFEIYGGWLGYDDDAINKLIEQKVI